MIYPLLNQQFASLKMAIEIVDLLLKKMVIFLIVMLVYQRVTCWYLFTGAELVYIIPSWKIPKK